GATTGTPLNFTVTARDAFGNIATGYTGKVHFTSSDPNAVLPADAALSSGQSAFTVTFKSAGTQTVTATDATANNPTITGTSSAVTTRGLTVVPGSFAPTATGFTVSFSKPFVPANLTLYGSNLTTPQDAVMFGQIGARALAATNGATETGNTVTLT